MAAMSVACFEVSGDSYAFLEVPSGDLGLAIAGVAAFGAGSRPAAAI